MLQRLFSGDAQGGSLSTTPNSPSKSIWSTSDGRGTSSCGPKKSSAAPWYMSGMVSKSATGGTLKARSMRWPWFRNAEPSSHCQVRGSGSKHWRASKGMAPRAAGAFTVRAKSCSAGSTTLQRSSASSSVGATGQASMQRRASSDTTTRRPSRWPLRKVASFMASPR